jgi:katanin p60 ATPase-containing subunit A1
MMPMRKKLLEGSMNLEAFAKMDQDDIDVPIKMSDFLEALKNIQKSVSKENLEEYRKWMAEFGSV